ncbi:MAG: TerB family tellurite resistance protein [Bacteroidales bacterium]|nr:TerB family tellurite resistance protein [Bacteroidales bacterium]
MDNTKFTKQFVALTMATLRADGIIEQVELDTIKQQAADLELDPIEVEKAIAVENSIQENVDIEKYIKEIGSTVDNMGDKHCIMDGCILVALSDKILKESEVKVLKFVCEALGFSLERMVLDIAIITQNDRSIKIEGSDSDFDVIIEDEEYKN